MQILLNNWDYVYSRSDKEESYKFFFGPVDKNEFINVIGRTDYEKLAQLMCMFPEIYNILDFVACEGVSKASFTAKELTSKIKTLAEVFNNAGKK